ncbi:MAG TPA: hypothetical protein VGD78_00440 [Chthoniobacterales bacterium]
MADQYDQSIRDGQDALKTLRPQPERAGKTRALGIASAGAWPSGGSTHRHRTTPVATTPLRRRNRPA